jgi:predicted DNA-binding protein
MRTTNPRIHTVLEPSLYKAVKTMAKQEHISLSQMVRDLIKESVELMEDRGLELIVEERRKNHDGKWMSLAEVKNHLKLA